MEIVYAVETALDSAEFLDILERSGLALRRPVDRPDRIAAMASNANLTVTARARGKLIGVARSVTDFAYCCYLSDLAVDAAHQRRGIGKRLIAETQKRLHPEASLILLSAPAAIDYYPKIGFAKIDRAFWLANGARVGE